ncbi:MAG: hypothetical protein RSD49_22740 [Hafnia sp.]|uniref:hypothetical protein n=1 Tax=Hafnia paralvei TaxID=546367 RepID=UPI000BB5617A|nr:hypothetical protein [Hafnia paralvei]MCE9948010.1 hypothetical protein [Hafnia paralvei]PNK68343.1 hypothetical protein A6J69_015465 [Hafnia paralvei]
MPLREEFIDVISHEIASHSALMELRELLVCFKNRGMPKDEMRLCLNNLRSISDEDVILELMDFAEGYCNPQLSIY